jgi:hypothetical protein
MKGLTSIQKAETIYTILTSTHEFTYFRGSKNFGEDNNANCV